MEEKSINLGTLLRLLIFIALELNMKLIIYINCRFESLCQLVW